MSARFETDGHTRPVRRADLVKGVILRSYNRNRTVQPFSDCVVVRVEGDTVSLARPYAWLTGVPGCERFTVEALHLVRGDWRTVLKSSGEPYVMGDGQLLTRLDDEQEWPEKY